MKELVLTLFWSPKAVSDIAGKAMGNITSKTDAGTLEYNVQGKPYAIGTQTGNPGSVPERIQDITYTGFQRPSTIEENSYKATFTYGPDYARNKMEIRNNSALQSTRYYLGGCYEKDVPASGSTTERLYIGGNAYSAPAVYIRTGSGAWTLHYIHRDHLGSITAITNSSGSRIAEYSFDPWGRQRNPVNQQAYEPDAAPSLLLGRGYTGHEHLPMFGLVNMNARLYDPVLGRFLSPDPHVQAPDWSQSFNRYSYCGNNPLMYVDENGEFILSAIIIGVVVSAAINYGSQVYRNYRQGFSGKDAWFNKIDFADVAISGIAGGLSVVFPAAALWISYATPVLQNAVDYTPSGQWKSVFHSGQRNKPWKEWAINSTIDVMTITTTRIWQKGIKPPEINYYIDNGIKESLDDVLSIELKFESSPEFAPNKAYPNITQPSIPMPVPIDPIFNKKSERYQNNNNNNNNNNKDIALYLQLF
jgi:RHS repeat-associated protein